MNKKILFIPLVAFLLLAGVFATQLMKTPQGMTQPSWNRFGGKNRS